ncbi:M48 family metallopeptidase [Allonocardiopsis opalescens]|nr:M48 family metallopeptidase [Allonocardiopsis opalescens]
MRPELPRLCRLRRPGIPFHPLERRLLLACVGVTGLTFVGVALRVMEGQADQTIALLALPVLLWITRGRLYAHQRVNGVRISENQFPEVHRMVVEASARLGLPRVPDAYVVLGNGRVNALASGHGLRRFVAVNSDLFEIGAVGGDSDALRFVIGHEVGHIAAGHASYWRQLGLSVANLIPFVGVSVNRAQEYTADNCAYLYCPEGRHGLRVLAAGKYLYRSVDFQAIADRAHTERGFFIWLVNALSSHPVNTWRFAALADRSRPGRVF